MNIWEFFKWMLDEHREFELLATMAPFLVWSVIVAKELKDWRLVESYSLTEAPQITHQHICSACAEQEKDDDQSIHQDN